MILKVILVTIILLAIATLGMGIKILFNKTSNPPSGSCLTANDPDQKLSCGCGIGLCVKD
ncbi:hypothetical protein ES705_05558 [subsurface metagenome]